MKSIRGCMPIFLIAEPQNTNTAEPAAAAFLMPSIISASVNSSPSRYFIKRSSSASAAASLRASLYVSTSSIMSAGISSSVYLPLPASKMRALFLIRSTTPLNLSSAPMGSCTGMIWSEKVLFICSITLKKSAFSRSILLMKASLGIWGKSSQATSVCTSTPALAENVITILSTTRAAPTTSK